MNNNEEKKRLAKNTILIAVGNIGAKVISFLLLPLYTSILSTSEYGLYDFIVTLSFFISPIVSLILYESLFRFLIEANANKDEEKINGIISSAFFLNILAFIAYSIISFIVYKIFNISYIFILTLYVIAGIVYTFFISILRGIDKIRYYAIYSSIKNILQVVFSVIAVTKLSTGVYGLLYATILSSFLISVVIFIQFKLWKYLKIKRQYIKIGKQLLKYSIPLIPNSISSSILSVSDRVAIKEYIGAEANGLYSIAYKFPSIIEVLYHFFSTAWNESASRVYETNKEKMKKYYQELYDIIKRIVIGGVICLISYMPILFKILIKGDYINAFNYVPLLLIAQMFNCLADYYSGILIANKDTKKIANSTVISAIMNIILNILLVICWGVYGVIIATLISNFVLFILRKRNSDKYIELYEDKKYNLNALIIAIIITLLYSYSNKVKIILGIFVSTTFFIISNKKNIQLILKYINGKIKGSKKNEWILCGN